MVREFVSRVFDGAPRPLLLHLVKEDQLSDDEREELLRLIRDAK
jgi:predicted transcriptional regulator